MSITTMIRLPEWAGEEIEKMSEQKGIAFATLVRSIVVEHLREIAPVQTAQARTDASQQPG